MSCPDDEAIRAGVVQRLGYDPFVAPVTKLFVAVIDVAEARYSATVSLQDPSGTTIGLQQLQYHLESCDELAAALELTVAVAIDPLADSFRVGAVPRKARVVVPPGVIAARADSIVPPPAAPPDPTPTAPPEERPSTEESRESPLGWRVWVAGGAAFDAAPTTAPMLAAGIERWVRRASLGLEVRGNLPSHENLTAGGSISTWQLVGALVPCYHLGVTRECALVGAGAQWASGQGLEPSKHQTTPYFALGVRLSGDLPLTRWFWIRPQVDLWVPTNRTTLLVANGAVWKTPALSPVVAVALVAALP